MKFRLWISPTRVFGLILISLLTGILPAYSGWQLFWSDEFNGSSINTNNWTFDIGGGGWGNSELEYYTSRPTNAFVTNGLLHIVARKESYLGSSYTSARLKTLGLFSQTYGRFEFYAKLPQSQGYWPALWLMPRDSVYGGWAASGEIDVMENRGSDAATVLGTIHFGAAYPNQAQSFGPAFTFAAGDSVTNFHLYALEWSSNAISWYVDSTLYETQTNWWSSSNPTNIAIHNPYPAPFNEPFYLIMNLAVGGNFGGNPNASTVFPGDMQIDYVRAYEWAGAPPPLKLRLALNGPPGTTTTVSDTNSGGVGLALDMVSGNGAAADFHGAAGSGVGGALNGNRALDFSSNGANQPGTPGPLAAATNAVLGFGSVSNFVVSLWIKQQAMMATGSNVGPRLFVLGAGAPSDTGAPNSLGLKFQTSSQLYFQLGGSITAVANFPSALPTNVWLFVAATYDGAKLTIYEGTETSSATVVSTMPAIASVNFGSSGALYIGNRQDRNRSFDGWMDDFRFYAGAGDAAFVESVRLQAANPPTAVSIQSSGTNVVLSWPNGTLLSATNPAGPWSVVNGATSPYTVAPTGSQQFYRTQVQ